jgi:inhibitor of KinA
MEMLPYGERGLRLIFGNEISADLSQEISRAFRFLRSASLPGVVDIIPSFTTCLVIFDYNVTSFRTIMSFIDEHRHEMAVAQLEEPAVHEIPVVYGGSYGPDLGFVCAYCGLSAEEVIEIHTSTVYTVFALGFLPGFPYLGPLDRRLFTPRLEVPVLKVPKGSVGIAQLQTGIYPFDSPAGWRIIGQTGAKLFEHTHEPYSMLKTGDLVRFKRAYPLNGRDGRGDR